MFCLSFNSHSMFKIFALFMFFLSSAVPLGRRIDVLTLPYLNSDLTMKPQGPLKIHRLRLHHLTGLSSLLASRSRPMQRRRTFCDGPPSMTSRMSLLLLLPLLGRSPTMRYPLMRQAGWVRSGQRRRAVSNAIKPGFFEDATNRELEQRKQSSADSRGAKARATVCKTWRNSAVNEAR